MRGSVTRARGDGIGDEELLRALPGRLAETLDESARVQRRRHAR
ncbi:hypothetical protein ABZ137_00980 [Streptomyces bobili]